MNMIIHGCKNIAVFTFTKCEGKVPRWMPEIIFRALTGSYLTLTCGQQCRKGRVKTIRSQQNIFRKMVKRG